MDVDGLPSCEDSVLVKLRKMEASHRAQLRTLTIKLRLAQEKVGTYFYTSALLVVFHLVKGRHSLKLISTVGEVSWLYSRPSLIRTQRSQI